MSLRETLLALLFAGGAAGAQTPVIRLDDAGQGTGPTLLRRAIEAPHIVIVRRDTAQAVLRRDSTYRGTVIVLARETVVDGTVEGDVIAIGGDLHIHPRAVITGRAIAIGGGVYESTMSRVGAGTMAFRDFTYDVTAVADGYALRYRSFGDRPDAAITWPGLYGLRAVTYDRSNGLSLAVGPSIAVPGTKVIVEPRLTYRSQLGAIDPALGLAYVLSSRTTVRVSALRGTFSNEEWIWPDLLNSASTLLLGHDTRNYYRGKRVEASLTQRVERDAVALEHYVGARTERDESVRPDSFATGGPWSFRGRKGRDDMLRANPAIDDGTISSAIAGIALRWPGTDITARASFDAELGVANPAAFQSNTFAQGTFDGSITMPTFRTQTLRVDGHFVVSRAFGKDADLVSPGGGVTRLTSRVPRQRWAYLGGSGSVPTLELLERGGDQLVYLDARYNIPVERVVLPLIGSPIVTLREVLAGADVSKFPSIAQAIGVRVAASVVYVDFMFNPATHKHRFGAGFSLAR